MCRFGASHATLARAGLLWHSGRMGHLTETSGSVSIAAATIALLDCEERSSEELATALGVAPPVTWPPEFNGQDYRNWQRKLLGQHPGEPGYAGWYVVGDGELVGTAGYKGPPNGDGAVEIGYSIIGPRRRRGFASGAVGLLVARAFRDDRVRTVLAETIPSLVASQAVLRRCEFLQVGTRVDKEDGEVLRFARKR
jgi:ribosomal-protein-alanine N-acetyltransferase